MTKESEIQTKQRSLEVVTVNAVDNETCRTFVMHREDHTLGNGLRYMVMKNPETEFCGYSVPHPSENKINFRIQTNGPAATEVLRKGLDDLTDVCQHTLSVFETSVEKFKATQTEESMET